LSQLTMFSELRKLQASNKEDTVRIHLRYTAHHRFNRVERVQDRASGIDEQADGSKVLCSWRVVGTASLKQDDVICTHVRVCTYIRVASETLGSRKSVIPKRTGRKRVVRVALFHPKRGLRWALSLSLSSPAIVIAMRRRCDAGKEGHVSFKEFSFPLDKYSLSGTVDLRAKRRNLLVWLLVVGGGSGCATSPPSSSTTFCVLDAAERCLLATVNGKGVGLVFCLKRGCTKSGIHCSQGMPCGQPRHKEITCRKGRFLKLIRVNNRHIHTHTHTHTHMHTCTQPHAGCVVLCCAVLCCAVRWVCCAGVVRCCRTESPQLVSSVKRRWFCGYNAD